MNEDKIFMNINTELKKNIYNNLPETIKTALILSEGWLVGGAIDCILVGKKPKDYDIVVPSRKLFQITTAWLKIGKALEINTFGGIKFKDTQVEIDIWCEELSHFIIVATKFKYAYNMKRDKLIEELK